MMRWLALVAVAALPVAGCGGGSDDTAAGPSSATGELPEGSDHVIEVRMLAERRFKPDTVDVKAGETVTFKVINEASELHEFMLGDEAMQAEHERTMSEMGTEPMDMDDTANSLTVKAGTTEMLTYTFKEAGTVLFGCHQPGHYAGGMKGTITVT